jgi:GTPase involved in cell partitioning and DNA repair
MIDMTNIELGYSLLAVILLMSLLTIILIINVLVMKKEGSKQEERFEKIFESVTDYEEYMKNQVSKNILIIIEQIEVLNSKDKAKKQVVEKVSVADESVEESVKKSTKAKKAEVIEVVEEIKVEDKIEE